MELGNELLKKLQDEELKILVEFDRVCMQLGINYSISSGTLLGGVRHKGFIPWDDDIDVLMLREDYNKFLEHGQKLLPDHYFIQTYETDREYVFNFAKIRNTSTVFKERHSSKLNIKNGLFIDVFPIDAVPSSRITRWWDKQLLSVLYLLKCLNLDWPEESFNGKMKRIFGPLTKIIGSYRLNTFETSIKVKGNKSGNKLTYADNSYIPPHRFKEKMLMPIDYFKDYEEIDFEQIKVKAIKDREAYLTFLYGDYMKLPPVEQRVPSHEFSELKI